MAQTLQSNSSDYNLCMCPSMGQRKVCAIFFRHIKSGEETFALNMLRAKRANPTISRCKGCDKPTYHQQGEKKSINEEQNNLHAETPNQRAIFIYARQGNGFTCITNLVHCLLLTVANMKRFNTELK